MDDHWNRLRLWRRWNFGACLLEGGKERFEKSLYQLCKVSHDISVSRYALAVITHFLVPKSSNLLRVNREEIRTFPNGGSTMRQLSLPILHNLGGGGEIRTLDTLRYATFPRWWNKPLSDASVFD